MWVWWCLFLILNVCVIWFDFSARRVPNTLLIVGLILQIIWLLWVDFYPVDTGFISASMSWAESLAGLLAGLVIFYPLWRFRAMGAGDVKFIALLGFFLGLPGQINALLLASILAGIHALGLVLHPRWPASLIRSAAPVSAKRSIPYAAYLALAVLGGTGWQLHTGQLWSHALWGG